ncbi:unnamed protein product [Amoebophrya sp. A120]|nr:unnamed protein product [Amoebophrya sp. A120]|eukprot:GSA120T00003180001.1
MAEDEFNPALKALKRPLWEMHKKGEIMPEADFYSKYYHFSHKPVRDSYPTAVIGKYFRFLFRKVVLWRSLVIVVLLQQILIAITNYVIRVKLETTVKEKPTRHYRVKYFQKMEEIRAVENDEPRVKDPDEWSDTSSHQSMFNSSKVKQQRGLNMGPAKREEPPAITAACAQIGKLIETDAVQKACKLFLLHCCLYFFGFFSQLVGLRVRISTNFIHATTSKTSDALDSHSILSIVVPAILINKNNSKEN